MKSSTLDGQPVKVIKVLHLKLTTPKGVELKPLVDKEGSWVQVEYISGANKGNRRPIPLEKLK
jgi:hypothetical protein